MACTELEAALRIPVLDVSHACPPHMCANIYREEPLSYMLALRFCRVSFLGTSMVVGLNPKPLTLNP